MSVLHERRALRRHGLLRGLAMLSLAAAAPALAAQQTNSTNTATPVTILAGNDFTNDAVISPPANVVPVTGAAGGVGVILNSGAGVVTATGTARAFDFLGTVSSFTNDGNINGFGGINFADDVGAFVNNGTIVSNSGGIAVNANAGAHVTSFINNSGALISTSGPNLGIFLTGGVDDVVNGGGISASGGFDTFQINGNVNSFRNLSTGVIESSSAPLTNRALDISGNVASFSNAGRISTTGGHALVITGTVGNFDNLKGGTLSGGSNGAQGEGAHVDGRVTNFNNAGTITGGTQTAVVLDGGVTSGHNSGDIISSAVANKSGVFIGNTNSANSFENSGWIEGPGGITFNATGGTDNTFVNSGTVKSTQAGNFAVDFLNGSDDTLQLLTGSELYGDLRFTSGDDTLDFADFYGTTILQTQGFTVGSDTIIAGDRPWADLGGGTIAIYDPTGATSLGIVISDSLGAIRNAITAELSAPNVTSSATTANGYVSAPDLGDATNATAAMSDLDIPLSGNPSVWAATYGGFSGSDTGPLDLSNVYGGLIVGAHTAIANQNALGGIVAYTRSTFDVDDGEQTINSDTVTGGLYGETDQGTLTLSYSLLGGLSSHSSTRNVVGDGTMNEATADFASWFLSPSVGILIPIVDGADGVINIAASTSYIFGSVGGYTEVIDGLGIDIDVGALPISVWEGRIELNGEKVITSSGQGDVTLSGKSGLMAQANFGGSSLPISIDGVPTADPFVVPGSSALGVYAGLGLEAPISANMNLSIEAEASFRSDGVGSASGSVGIGGVF